MATRDRRCRNTSPRLPSFAATWTLRLPGCIATPSFAPRFRVYDAARQDLAYRRALLKLRTALKYPYL